MRVKRLLTEEGAVSPVIGIILMVAITVILAAVIGSFVLGIGDSVDGETPTTAFDFAYEPNDAGYAGPPHDDAIRVTVAGGDTIFERVELKVGANRVDESGGIDYSPTGGFSTPIEGGEEVVVQENGTNAIHAGDEVYVIYQPDKPQVRAIIGSSEVPT